MLLNFSVMFGLTAGLCSAIYFLSLVLFGPNLFVTAVLDLAGVAALWRWARIPERAQEEGRPAAWLRAVFLAALTVASVCLVLIEVKQPHGDWDAWSIWNLHARLLERGGSNWIHLFPKELVWTHPDYPLLLPAFVAQIWAYLHSETVLVPIAIGLLFTLGTVAILMATVRSLRGWDQALIAGTVLLCTATFIRQGGGQYADIPLAFFTAGSLALLCFDCSKCTMMAGALAGCAAWTKNEGILFVIALVLARSVALASTRQGSRLPGELARFAAGAAPMLAVLAFFKLGYAPATDLISAHAHGEISSRLSDMSRWMTTAAGFLKHGFFTGGMIVPAIVVLAAYAYLVGFDRHSRLRPALYTIAGAIVLMLVGDFVVYAVLSNDIDWQISTSLDRVLMQLWPAALMAFFIAVRKPELAPQAIEKMRHEKNVKSKHATATRRR